jgi:hypothetical protein
MSAAFAESLVEDAALVWLDELGAPSIVEDAAPS